MMKKFLTLNGTAHHPARDLYLYSSMWSMEAAIIWFPKSLCARLWWGYFKSCYWLHIIHGW